LIVALGAAGPGCEQAPSQGPGHRPQALALSPYAEFNLGEQAYAEVLKKYHGHILPDDDPRAEVVRQVGERIAKAAANKPLQHEINLHLEGYRFEWRFTVLQDDQVNAFCLPGGKVAVYTGLLPVVSDPDKH